MIKPNYCMKAKVERVIDGDSLILTVSPAYRIYLKDYKFRLYGIDTPEMNSKDPVERARALVAKNFVINKVEGKEVLIESIEVKGFEKADSFGRYLVKIYYEFESQQFCLNDELISTGHAKEFVP